MLCFIAKTEFRDKGNDYFAAAVLVGPSDPTLFIMDNSYWICECIVGGRTQIEYDLFYKAILSFQDVRYVSSFNKGDIEKWKHLYITFNTLQTGLSYRKPCNQHHIEWYPTGNFFFKYII